MKTILRINPAFYAATCFIGLLIAGILLGGFGQTQANGSAL